MVNVHRPSHSRRRWLCRTGAGFACAPAPGAWLSSHADFRTPFPEAKVNLPHCHSLEHEDAGKMLRVRVG